MHIFQRDILASMTEERRPKATPEQAAHYAAGWIKVTEFTITDPAYQPAMPSPDEQDLVDTLKKTPAQ
jgi:hypothetical protein